jgi:hypothetical protein
MIIGKLSGANAERTFVFAGMSGSPVYIDGRLVGAISYSFPFAKEPICGITPIEQMIAIFEKKEGSKMTASEPKSVSFAELASTNWTSDCPKNPPAASGLLAGVSNNSLLMAVGKHWTTLAGTAVGLLLAHHFISAKRFEPILFRGISAGAAFLIYVIVGVVSLTRTSSEMAETKFDYHCLTHYKEAKCQPILENLPQRGLHAMAARLQALQKQLSTKR